MTAEDILKKHIEKKMSGISAKLRLVSCKDIELAAMKEIAEIAFEAGYNNGAIENNAFISKADPTIKYPNKQDFINSLFPKEDTV